MYSIEQKKQTMKIKLFFIIATNFNKTSMA